MAFHQNHGLFIHDIGCIQMCCVYRYKQPRLNGDEYYIDPYKRPNGTFIINVYVNVYVIREFQYPLFHELERILH